MVVPPYGSSPAAPTPAPPLRPPPPPHPTLPLAVAVGALLCVAVPLIAGGQLLAPVDALELPVALYVAIAVAVVYGPSMIWWWYASARYGSGRRGIDVGLMPRPSDLGWGPLAWLGCLFVQAVIGFIVTRFDVPFTSNTEALGDGDDDLRFIIAIVVLTVVVAPIAEEIVFRGLVLRGLLGSMGPTPAVALQAVLFGVVHISPGFGLGNIGLVLVLTGVGAVLGVVAHVFRRITPCILAHAILNAVAVTLALAGVGQS